MSYTFIKKNQFGHSEAAPVLAISQEIETLRLSETYDQFGQQVGHTNAGDSSIHNSEYCDTYYDLLAAIREKFGLDTDLEFDIDVNELTATEEIPVDPKELKEFCEAWCEENEYFITVKGFDYWDGSNWKTITVEAEVGETSHELVTDGVEDLNREIDESKFVTEGYGKRVYESENYWIVESFFSGAFEKYSLYPKIDFELEQVK